MASACVNNIGVTPESYGWLSPKLSFSHESKPQAPPEDPDPTNDNCDFEFRLDDPVTMLPADELFFNGKLVPLQFTANKTAKAEATKPRIEIVGDPYLQSPRAPRCSVRWRELLGFKKNKAEATNSSSIRQFLHRNSKSMESDSSTTTSRLSLSSSSSSHDHDDLPRTSLDAIHPQISNPNPRSRLRRPIPATVMENLPSDSPRMSSSGKIVFQNLGRSSSSPSSFNGGPRHRHRGMERSYSANVRVTPLLNVPVCSLQFGFGPKKKEASTSTSTRASRR